MDESSIVDQLRAGASGIGTDDSDLDALVHGAVEQGRRRRTRRRVGAALGTVVAAAVLVAVVATGVVPAHLGTSRPDPVASPVVATPALPTPAPSTTPPGPPVSASPPPTATEQVRATPEQVRTTLAGLLPGSLTVTRSSAAREKGSNGFPFEDNAALTVRDGAGTAYLFGGIGNGVYDDGCEGATSCQEKVLPDGGVVWVTEGPPGDKTGTDREFRYARAGGGHVWLMERNFDGGTDPVTREDLPLTAAEGLALVTSPQWDRLFRG